MNVYLAALSQELAQQGVELDIYTRWHGPEDPQVLDLRPGLRVIHLEAGGRMVRPKEELYPLLPEFLRSLLAFQRAQRLSYDLVHSHYWLSGWVGGVLRRQWDVPHVVMFHTLGAVKNQMRAGEREPQMRIRTEQRIIARADAVVVASSQEQQQMTRLYQVPPGRVHVIPGGVDLDLFRPMDQRLARRELGLNGEKILLFVGRPDPLKGLEILLTAAAQLEHPAGVRVLVVGGQDGAQTELLGAPRDAASPGPKPAVSYHGSVAHQMLPYFYNAADVCVVPSYYESFGMVAVEAMACGTPVVAARVGGLQSTVRDGETGFLIPWHCPEPYAERLELLLGNDALRTSQSVAARAAMQPFGWATVAEQVLGVYREMTGA